VAGSGGGGGGGGGLGLPRPVCGEGRGGGGAAGRVAVVAGDVVAGFFSSKNLLSSISLTHVKLFAECVTKKTLGKELFSVTRDAEWPLPRVPPGRTFSECFVRFAECF
jgi:hypothetical protein